MSPQNPLKPVAGMAAFEQRLSKALAVAANDRRIRVSDIEADLGTRYTADTLTALRRRFPQAHFVWLMGSDNLQQFPSWKRWQNIFRTVPIAVFDRPNTGRKALAGVAARRFARRRVSDKAARRLAMLPPPAWIFFHTRLDPRSATQIRAERMSRPSNQEKKITVIAEDNVVTPLPRRKRQSLTPAELLSRVLASLEDGKAEDIVTIDLAGKTTIADYMVIASGRSGRQVTSLTEHLEQVLPVRLSIEGKAQADWVLVDAGDVIVHIFRPEMRAYYNLEKMWGSGLPEIEVEAEATRH